MDIAFTLKESQSGRIGPGDVSLNGPDFASDKDLESVIIISLFTDRRAEEDDNLEGGGWWADTFAEDKIGSRLWILAREKQTQSTLNRSKAFIQESLSWLVEDGVASEVLVENEWIRSGVMGVSIEVVRPQIAPLRFRYQFAWNQLNAL